MQARKPDNAQGIDVSRWQGVIDWQQVKDAGKSFAIIKATEGRTMIDDYLSANISGARAVGMATGVYHFCRASNVEEAAVEAQFFMDTVDSVGGVKALDIPPMLDIETVHADSREAISAICHVWLEAVQQRYGVEPMIYTFPWFADTYLDPSLSKYRLWLADYQGDVPRDRSGWSEWTFLQYSQQGQVPGISGFVDLNEFNGGVDMLMIKMDPAIAQALIDACKAHYSLAQSDEDRNAWHERAEEIRKVSGLPPDA